MYSIAVNKVILAEMYCIAVNEIISANIWCIAVNSYVHTCTHVCYARNFTRIHALMRMCECACAYISVCVPLHLCERVLHVCARICTSMRSLARVCMPLRAYSIMCGRNHACVRFFELVYVCTRVCARLRTCTLLHACVHG